MWLKVGEAMIRVLLAYKGGLLREALAAFIAKEEDLQVIGQLARGDELVAAVRRHRPDVAVVDCALPGPLTMSDLCKALVAVLPTGGVLVVLDPPSSAGIGGELVRLAPRVGVVGTEAASAELIEGIRSMARGEPVLDAKVAVAALTAGDNPLTGRERQILRLAVDGTPPTEIARTLFLSAGTVRNYMSSAVAKTGARNRIEAIRVAQEAGWI